MQIQLTGDKAIYEEIIDAIKKYIDVGVLKPDEKLPSVRDLATSLSINPNTVVRAYDLLVERGYVVSFPKRGYYVKPQKKQPESPLKILLKEIIAQGTSVEEIETTLAQIDKEIKRKEGKKND
jgi:GntR family transcriptional regulator